MQWTTRFLCVGFEPPGRAAVVEPFGAAGRPDQRPTRSTNACSRNRESLDRADQRVVSGPTHARRAGLLADGVAPAQPAPPARDSRPPSCAAGSRLRRPDGGCKKMWPKVIFAGMVTAGVGTT